MSGHLHVIGGGVSGLAAAFLANRGGWRTTLHEATPKAGGRCKTIERNGIRHDNGTHVLFSANRTTLGILETIGARDRWVEPEPDGLPVVDLVGGSMQRVGLSPWSWAIPSRRPLGMNLRELGRLLPLLAPVPPGRDVASYAAGLPKVAQLLELMTVAILNTPQATASAKRLSRVLRRMLLPGAAHLLIARTGLGPDLVEPLQAAVAKQADLRFGRRLTGLVQEDGRVRALRFGDGAIELAPEDRVILALPGQAASLLLPELSVPARFAPIVNLHFPHEGHGPIRFVGITEGLSQWLLIRPGMASVTISAAGSAVDAKPDELAALVWPEVAAAAARCGVPLPGASVDRALVVKERMATPLQDCAFEAAARPPRRPLANLVLAGDWLADLPATIEAAVVSAKRAVGLLGTPPAQNASIRPTRREVAA